MLSGEEAHHRGIVDPREALGPDQVQVNGIDLTLDAVWRILGRGSLGVASADRELPRREALATDALGWFDLPPGAYGIRYAEIVHVPVDCGGLAFPRSSLLRMGAHIPTAVWDAGYRGRAESLLVVTAPDGIRLQRTARVSQLVLFRLTEPTTGYAGRYQGENLDR